jgi:hypothetical protein
MMMMQRSASQQAAAALAARLAPTVKTPLAATARMRRLWLLQA